MFDCFGSNVLGFLGQGFLPFSDSRLDPKLKFLIFTVGLYYSNLNFPHTCVSTCLYKIMS